MRNNLYQMFQDMHDTQMQSDLSRIERDAVNAGAELVQRCPICGDAVGDEDGLSIFHECED